MWQEIHNEKDLLHFLNKMNFFHDSCIKEIRYLSGAYVNNNLSMYPINDKRNLTVVIQRQYEEHSMIEMEFTGLKYLKLFPIDDRYTCEILDSTMFIKDKFIYWCDSSISSENDIENYSGTAVCALGFRWRSVEGHMGKGDFFRTSW